LSCRKEYSFWLSLVSFWSKTSERFCDIDAF
jgi:hypothetical protein